MKNSGPLLTDRLFFTECLDYSYPGLGEVASMAAKASENGGDFSAARTAFGAFLRRALRPDIFFTIPYEEPENIFRLPGESDSEAASRIRRHTLVAVGIPMTFSGGVIDWEANPTANGYKEWVWQLNRLPELKLLAHEYREHGSPWIPETAAELFSSWVKQAVAPVSCSGHETSCWRTIECGIRMGANLPYALHAFLNTPAFSDDLLTDWSKSLVEHGIRLSTDYTSGNWLIMEMNGLAHIAMLNPWLSRSADWLKQAFQMLEQELDRQIYPDGFQCELATGYHNVVVNNYQRMFATASAYRIPVPSSLKDKLQKAAEFEAKLMMPDTTTPDINDGARVPVSSLAERRLAVYPDSRMLRWMLLHRRDDEPDFTSVALPYSGLAVMRTGWDADASWVLFDGGPFGTAHQHEDKLSVLFYSGGKLLLTEGGNYAYDHSPMRCYVLSAESHNTVRVDGCGQDRRTGYRWDAGDIKKEAGLSWHFGDIWDHAGAVFTEGFGQSRPDGGWVASVHHPQIQVRHERKVFFCRKPGALLPGGILEGLPPFLVIVDRLYSDKVHHYQALWHIDSTPAETKEAGSAGEGAKTTKGGTTALRFSDCVLASSCGNNSVVCGQEAPEWQGFAATGTIQGMYRPVPCVQVNCRAANLRMVTVISPDPANEHCLLSVSASADISAQSVRLSFRHAPELFLREDLLA